MTLKEKPVVVMYGDSNTDIDPERLTGKCCIYKETANTTDEAKTLISENSDKVKSDIFLFMLGQMTWTNKHLKMFIATIKA